MPYCAALLIWIVAGVLPATGQQKKPAIVFDRIVGDAGTVMQGEIARQVFTFTNKGSGTLEIIGVKPT